MGNVDLKLLKGKKNAEKDLPACGTPSHVEGQAFSNLINKLSIDIKATPNSGKYLLKSTFEK